MKRSYIKCSPAGIPVDFICRAKCPGKGNRQRLADYVLTRIRSDDIDPVSGKATAGRFRHFSYFPLQNEVMANDEKVEDIIDWVVEQNCKWHVRATQRVQWIVGQCSHRHYFSFEDETVAVDFKLRYS